MIVLSSLFILAFVSVSASEDTCNGLEQLAMNTNQSSLLSNCTRDESCSRISCEPSEFIGIIGIDSVIITLELCEIPGSPGVRIEVLKDGHALVNQLITTPTNVTWNLEIVTVDAYVFVNSTDNTLGLSIDPVFLNVTSLGFRPDQPIITFTQIPISTSQCNNNIKVTTGPTTTTVTTDMVKVTKSHSTSTASTGSTTTTVTTDTVEATDSDSTSIAATGSTTPTATTVTTLSSVTPNDAVKDQQSMTTESAASGMSVLFGFEIVSFLLTLAVINY